MTNAMKKLKESLSILSDAYRAVALDEMDKGVNGSPDIVYDCIRHHRTALNRLNRLDRFGSIY